MRHQPQAGCAGPASFTDVVCDGTFTATAPVVVGNQAPITHADVIFVTFMLPYTMGAHVNDHDLEGRTLSVISATIPAHGKASPGAGGVVQYQVRSGSVDVATYPFCNGTLQTTGAVSMNMVKG